LRALALAGLALAACAPVGPVLAGGRTTPNDRSDLALGAAVRVPMTDLVPAAMGPARELTTFGASGGAAPVAAVRHGLNEDVDLGVEAVGSSMRVTLRGQIPIGPAFLIGGISPEGGLVYSDPREGTMGGSAFRGGATVPLLFALDLFSLYELWIGPRFGLAHIGGDSAGRSVAFTGLRAGGVVGMAVGFRRIHLLADLAIDYEHWCGSLGGTGVERDALVLTPAFAIRIRI
jgi:hypothetical protein